MARKTNPKNYANAKVYVIRNTQNDKVYVGSTTQPLSSRMAQHRNNTNIDKIKERYFYKHMVEVGIQHFYIELLEEFPCENIEQLLKREGYWIREMNAFNDGYNTTIAGRDHTEYLNETKEQRKEQREQNKVLYLEYQKKWREANKEKRREYYEANRENLKMKKKEYYEEHKEAVTARTMRNREKNKEAYLDYQRKWREQKRRSHASSST